MAKKQKGDNLIVYQIVTAASLLIAVVAIGTGVALSNKASADIVVPVVNNEILAPEVREMQEKFKLEKSLKPNIPALQADMITKLVQGGGHTVDKIVSNVLLKNEAAVVFKSKALICALRAKETSAGWIAEEVTCFDEKDLPAGPPVAGQIPIPLK